MEMECIISYIRVQRGVQCVQLGLVAPGQRGKRQQSFAQQVEGMHVNRDPHPLPLAETATLSARARSGSVSTRVDRGR
jgi:hypothetical protein